MKRIIEEDNNGKSGIQITNKKVFSVFMTQTTTSVLHLSISNFISVSLS
jgi:hypothetical protein